MLKGRRRLSKVLLALWVACVVCGAGHTAYAQGDPLDLENMLEKRELGERARPVVDGPEVRPPEVNDVQLDVQWSLRRESDNDEARERLFERVLDIGQRLGYSNQPYRARALLDEAAALLSSGRVNEARSRIEQARRLAPDLPAVDFTHAALVLQTNAWNVPALVSSVGRAYVQMWRFLPARMVGVTNGLLALWVSLVIFGLSLVVITSGRHLGLLADDLRAMLPEGVARGQVLLFLFLAILMPALLTGSLMVSAVVLTVMVGVYMSWTERLAVSVVLAMLALAPQTMAFGAAGLSFPGTEINDLARWSVTGCHQECLDGIDAYESRDKRVEPKIQHTREVLRIDAALRRGPAKEWSKLRKRLEALNSDSTLPLVMSAAVLDRLGVAQALTGDLDEAEKTFSRTARQRPKDYRPLLNLFRVLELKEQDEAAAQVMTKAIKLGGAAAADRSQINERVVSLWFLMSPVSTEPLFKLHMASAMEADGGEGNIYWRRIGGDLPLGSMPLLAGGALAILWALTLIGRLAGASSHCPRCGQQMNPHMEGLRGQEGEVCRGCATHFGGGQMSYQERVEHEAALTRFQSRRMAVFWLGNLLPGLGSSLVGTSLGLLPVLFVSLSVSLLLTGDPLPDPWRSAALWTDGRLVIGTSLLLLALAITLTLMWLGVPRYRAPLRTFSREYGDEGDDDEGDYE